MKKPSPDELAALRALFPKGAPRLDYREMMLVIGRAPADGDDSAAGDEHGVIPIAISSEAPVLRYDWWDDEYYYEVLDHSAKSVSMDYCKDGMPFVASHRAWDADSQHGIVENITVGKDRIMRGEARMSRAARSQEIAQDMRDGIRKKVSVGYIVGDEFDQTEKAKDGIPIRRYMAWMPLEVSTVPLPADYTVGVGRARSPEGQAAIARFLQLVPAKAAAQSPAQPAEGERSALPVAPPVPIAVPTAVPVAAPPTIEPRAAEERTMKTDETAAAAATNTGTNTGTPSVQVTRDNEADKEQSRIDAAKNLGRAHGVDERIAEWIRSGKTTEQMKDEVNAVLAERLKNPLQPAAPLDLTKEKRTYSFARAILEQAELSTEGKIDAGFEREITQELRKSMPNTERSGAMVLPLHFNDRFAEEYAKQQGRAGIDSGVATTGGAFKFTQPGDFLTMLRNRTALLRLGATFLTGLTGPVTFPKQNGAATASWIGENPGSDASDSNLTVTTVSLAFKTLMSTTSVSRQALFSAASGNYDLEAIIRSDMAAVIALALDAGGVSGPGTANQPTGILGDTAIGSVTLGTNGGTVAWGDIVDLETLVGEANADQLSGIGYLTNPRQRGRMKKLAVLGNTASGVPIWTGRAGEPDGELNGYRAVSTMQVPKILTKGTSTTICSAIIFGAFSSVMIGQFGNGFEILADPYRLKKQAMIELTAFTFADIARRYSEAFAAIKDAL